MHLQVAVWHCEAKVSQIRLIENNKIYDRTLQRSRSYRSDWRFVHDLFTCTVRLPAESQAQSQRYCGIEFTWNIRKVYTVHICEGGKNLTYCISAKERISTTCTTYCRKSQTKPKRIRLEKCCRKDDLNYSTWRGANCPQRQHKR
jgi:hypothetical protein